MKIVKKESGRELGAATHGTAHVTSSRRHFFWLYRFFYYHVMFKARIKRAGNAFVDSKEIKGNMEDALTPVLLYIPTVLFSVLLLPVLLLRYLGAPAYKTKVNCLGITRVVLDSAQKYKTGEELEVSYYEMIDNVCFVKTSKQDNKK